MGSINIVKELEEQFNKPDFEPLGKHKSILEKVDPNVLESIISNEENTLRARFYAIDILLWKEKRYKVKKEQKTLFASILSASLQKLDFPGNVWGLPGKSGWSSAVERLFVSIGKEAIPFLTPLLSDSRELLYEGSEEATLGSMFKCRVKDIAAWILSKLLSVNLKFSNNPMERDEDMKLLHKKLIEIIS